MAPSPLSEGGVLPDLLRGPGPVDSGDDLLARHSRHVAEEAHGRGVIARHAPRPVVLLRVVALDLNHVLLLFQRLCAKTMAWLGSRSEMVPDALARSERQEHGPQATNVTPAGARWDRIARTMGTEAEMSGVKPSQERARLTTYTTAAHASACDRGGISAIGCAAKAPTSSSAARSRPASPASSVSSPGSPRPGQP